MIGLIIKTPLADHEVGPAGFTLLDHVAEIRLLPLEELVVVLLRTDVELVLRLGFWGFKRTREDAHLDVPDLLRHLGMAHVLVDDDALDQLRLLEPPAGLALRLL